MKRFRAWRDGPWAIALAGIVAGRGDAQIVWTPIVVAPVTPFVVPVAPMATVSASPAATSASSGYRSSEPNLLIERFYLRPGDRSSRYAPQGSSSSTRRARPGAVIVREYYLDDDPSEVSATKPLTPRVKEPEADAEKEPAKPPSTDDLEPLDNGRGKLSMPPPGKSGIEPPANKSSGYAPDEIPSAKQSDAKESIKSESADRPPVNSQQNPTDGSTADGVAISGLFSSVRADRSPLADMTLAFVDPDGDRDGAETVTDRHGRFTMTLPTGDWLVYFVYPEGGRRYLQTVTVDKQRNPVFEIRN